MANGLSSVKNAWVAVTEWKPSNIFLTIVLVVVLLMLRKSMLMKMSTTCMMSKRTSSSNLEENLLMSITNSREVLFKNSVRFDIT